MSKFSKPDEKTLRIISRLWGGKSELFHSSPLVALNIFRDQRTNSLWSFLSLSSIRNQYYQGYDSLPCSKSNTWAYKIYPTYFTLFSPVIKALIKTWSKDTLQLSSTVPRLQKIWVSQMVSMLAIRLSTRSFLIKYINGKLLVFRLKSDKLLWWHKCLLWPKCF